MPDAKCISLQLIASCKLLLLIKTTRLNPNLFFDFIIDIVYIILVSQSLPENYVENTSACTQAINYVARASNIASMVSYHIYGVYI